MGFVVLLGWYAHIEVLVQVHPAFVPMQFNTALGFLLCGIGLLSLVCSRSRVGIACGTAAVAVGLLTLIEYIFGVSLGIDQLLMDHYVTVKTFRYPGRMGPNTALSFVLTGAAILVASGAVRSRQRLLISMLLGSVIAALGMVAFLGYLSGVETSYGWGRLPQMAVHTAAGFAVLGAGIFGFAWRAGAGEEVSVRRWLAIPVALGVGTLSVALWQALVTQEHAQIVRTVQSEANILRTTIKDRIEPQILALVRMAERWEMRGGIPREEWEADAALYLAHESSYRGIAWVDSSSHVQWNVPLAQGKTYRGLDLAREERRREALEAAREGREVRVTRALHLFRSDSGFLVFVPLFVGERFDGYMMGVIRIQELLHPILSETIPLGYSIVVSDGEEEVYSRFGADRRHEEQWGQETAVQLQNVVWRVRIWPSAELLAQWHSHLPEVVLCGWAA